MLSHSLAPTNRFQYISGRWVNEKICADPSGSYLDFTHILDPSSRSWRSAAADSIQAHGFDPTCFIQQPRWIYGYTQEATRESVNKGKSSACATSIVAPVTNRCRWSKVLGRKVGRVHVVPHPCRITRQRYQRRVAKRKPEVQID